MNQQSGDPGDEWLIWLETRFLDYLADLKSQSLAKNFLTKVTYEGLVITTHSNILTSLVYAMVPIHMDWMIGVVLACAYEACLLFTPLASFLDSDNRSGFLAANKEGLASIAGYVALHLAAAATARTLGYKPRSSARDWIMTGLQAVGVSGAAFTATYVMHTAVDPVSRRLANLSYCLWMNNDRTSVIISEWVCDQNEAVSAARQYHRQDFMLSHWMAGNVDYHKAVNVDPPSGIIQATPDFTAKSQRGRDSRPP
ncbi:hypothetical protein HPB51_004355 [Rhipicephalus microplus]|uniref:Uncharacterized protein n=1 Tax=Rhipicephalus microplus TaxID=6941 RepID=A0A9J6EL99_RHIMP|nr:hypothetical protein HPB51_004355 [Rhipicephalus microplus]